MEATNLWPAALIWLWLKLDSTAKSSSFFCLNNLKRSLVWLFIATLCVSTPGLIAQPLSQTPAEKIEQLQQLYRNLQFEKVIQEGRTLLTTTQNLTPQQLAKIHEQMALSFFSLGQLDSSKAHFLSLLSLFPHWKLDPIYVSPKIIDFFEKLKSQMPEAEVPVSHYTRYIILQDLRPGATWRSVLLPGWGQWYKNQKKRALWVGGAVAVAGIGTLAAALMEKSAHQQYLQAQSEQQIQETYDRYNRWFKTRRTLTVVTFIAWTLNVADALWTPSVSTQQVQVKASAEGLSVTFQF